MFVQHCHMEKNDSNCGETAGSSRTVPPVGDAMDMEMLTEVLSKGIDLREFARDTTDEMKKLEVATIQDYIEHAESLADLHNQICSCDGILLKMETMLSGFQSDLSSISDEIQSLQEQSVNMSVKLKNRQVVRNELSQFIDEIVVPEIMIKTMMDEPATESCFLEQLHELQHKIVYVRHQAFREAVACQEVENVLNNLKLKAVEKTRELLLRKIYQLRKPLANYEVTQNSLLKYRFYFEFILSNDRHVAKEIRDEYVNTMSKVLFSYFKTFMNRLIKLRHDDAAGKDDLLGTIDSGKTVSLFYGKPSSLSRAPVFSLSNRDSIVTTDLEAPVIVPHAAEQSKTKFHFEAIFRSILYALLDHAGREYFFLCDFFLVSGHHSTDMFDQVFGRTLSLVTGSFDGYISNNFDCIALLLVVQTIRKYQALCLKRGLAVLERLWNALMLSLWPRIDHLIHTNLASFRELDLRQLAPFGARPLFIVRRYAEFFAALTTINMILPEERIQQYLYLMESELAGLMSRIKAQLSSSKERLVFLINNYDLVVSVLTERISGDLVESQESHKRLQAYVNEYADTLLSLHFGDLVKFVHQCESLVEQQMQEKLKEFAANATGLIRSFNSDWKRSIEAINQEVMANFSNFRISSNVLQNCLTQLVSYYHRLHKVLSTPALSNLPARNELVNIHNLMVEVRKFKPCF
uniref:Vacuolar protein sorting-associated protein 52 homolog n=1 Tax=Trichuris muris TaxID=70415 RepID=A0A5S6R094_TRIMR